MKRSEALKFIADELYGRSLENWEEQILTTVEKMGMLPPRRPVLSINPKLNIGNVHLEPALVILDSMTWEEE